MTSSQLRDKLQDEIRELPDSRLQEAYDLLQVFPSGLKRKHAQGEADVMRFAGAWGDMDNFEAFAVAYQGASFELTRGGRRIARLIPAGPPKRVEVSELNGIFAGIPSLGDDAASFERDIADAQSVIVADKDPWED